MNEDQVNLSILHS